MNGMASLLAKQNLSSWESTGLYGTGTMGSFAAANSPLPGLLDSVAQFDALHIPRTQIVMGLPWYGDDYACNASVVGSAAGGNCTAYLNGAKPWGQFGKRLQYEQAAALLESDARATSVAYERQTASAHFDYLCPSSNVTSSGYACEPPGRHQVWVDTQGSLMVKMASLRDAGLRGVAVWDSGSIDYAAEDHQGEAMWDAFLAFAAPRA